MSLLHRADHARDPVHISEVGGGYLVEVFPLVGSHRKPLKAVAKTIDELMALVREWSSHEGIKRVSDVA